MKHESFFLETEDQQKLRAMLWIPEKECRCILVICHGMTEHITRYESLAETLTSAGIITAGFDLRGHGTLAPKGPVAYMEEDGWLRSIEDLHRFHGILIRRFPNLPISVMGFSLGSFLVRDTLSRYPNDYQSAIIAGTGDQPSWILMPLIKKMEKEVAKAGLQETTPLVEKLSFETYNQKFKSTTSRFDWLCSDVASRREYEADPGCKESISAGLFCDLLKSMKRTGELSFLAGWEKDLPVLLLSGAEDPVGNFKKGVLSFAKKLKKAGHPYVECVLLPNARHDLFHEYENGAAGEAASVLKLFLLKQLFTDNSNLMTQGVSLHADSPLADASGTDSRVR